MSETLVLTLVVCQSVRVNERAKAGFELNLDVLGDTKSSSGQDMPDAEPIEMARPVIRIVS